MWGVCVRVSVKKGVPQFVILRSFQVIEGGMKEEWPHLDISISPRDDLMLNHFYKVRVTCGCVCGG